MRILVTAAVICLLFADLACAGDVRARTRKATDIPPQELSSALSLLATEFHFQVLYRTEVVGHLRTTGVSGSVTVSEALEQLLRGTGLTFQYVDDKTFTIVRSAGQGSTSPSEVDAPDENPEGGGNDREQGASSGRPGSPNRVADGSNSQGASLSRGAQSSARSEHPDPADEAGLPEITVSAQKITENLRQVPISISVVNQAQIRQQRIIDIGDLTRVVPNFSYTTSGNPGGANLQMRGISSSAGASTVGIYLDDVSIASSKTGGFAGQAEPQLLDIQQVEVLRGPQGTLYGASAEGGVIKYHTNPVNLRQFGADALGEVSSTQHGGLNYKATGVLNLPVVPGAFGIRLAAQVDNHSGFIDRYSPDTHALTAKDINDHRATAARLSLEARPIDPLTIAAAVFYQRVAYGSTDTVSLGFRELATERRVRDAGQNTLIVPSLTLKYDLGWSDLTSVTSDTTLSQPYVYDGTAFNSGYTGDLLDSLDIRDLNGNLSGSKIAALPSPGHATSFVRQFTQELRLSSKSYAQKPSPITWVAGFYYERSKSRFTDAEPILGFNETFTALYGPAALDAIFGGPLSDEQTFFSSVNYTDLQYSAFGEVTFHFTDALRLSAGLRYLAARDSQRVTLGGFYSAGGIPSDDRSKDHALTPRLSLVYDLSPRVSTYATVSKGFRLGGPNTPVPSDFCAADLAELGYGSNAPASYRHDDLWNYEIGIKTAPSRRVQFNAAVFLDRWSGLQQNFTLPTCGFSFIDNVGTARSYGTEVDAAWLPIDGLTLSSSLGYTHASLTQSIPGAGIVEGELVQGVPQWSATASANYEFPLLSTYTGYIRADYSYTGESHGSLLANSPDYIRRSYGVAGASIGTTLNEWDLSLFVKNLFNSLKIVQTPPQANSPVGYIILPRVIGLTVSKHF